MAASGTSLDRIDAVMRPSAASAATLVAVLVWLTRDGTALDAALIWPTVAAFWLWAARRTVPSTVPMGLATAVPVVLNIVMVHDEISMMFHVLTVTYVALYSSSRPFAWVYSVAVVATNAVLFATGAYEDFGVANWTFGIALSAVFGEVGARLRSTIGELEATRAAMVEQATALERKRIARDVHDMVGHSLAVVMLHLTGARHVLRSDPDEAERALEQAEDVGRASMVEIRRTIAMLREPSDDGAAAPSPDLTDLEQLVDGFRTAGADIDVTIDGDVEPVDDSVGLAAFRIVQEGLTNATRHAPAQPISLAVHCAGDTCRLVLRNRLGASTGSRSVAPGFGLIGMQERARSVGGSLTAGPSGGTWSVDALLPVRATQGAGSGGVRQ